MGVENSVSSYLFKYLGKMLSPFIIFRGGGGGGGVFSEEDFIILIHCFIKNTQGIKVKKLMAFCIILTILSMYNNDFSMENRKIPHTHKVSAIWLGNG